MIPERSIPVIEAKSQSNQLTDHLFDSKMAQSLGTMQCPEKYDDELFTTTGIDNDLFGIMLDGKPLGEVVAEIAFALACPLDIRLTRNSFPQFGK